MGHKDACLVLEMIPGPSGYISDWGTMILKDYQLKAVKKMRNGCVLYAGVGTGKSRTALAYYYNKVLLHAIDTIGKNKTAVACDVPLIIITTAKKRDSLEWESEAAYFTFEHKGFVVDSWNNIKKYVNIKNAFFIFDEQRVVGNGVWVKSFLKIVKSNRWILLTATPGDTWIDYMPLFVGNGFYKSRTDFIVRHVIYSRYTTYPRIDRYVDVAYLEECRSKLLVVMNSPHSVATTDTFISCDYNVELYKTTQKNYWNPYKEEPIQSGSELCYTLRKICNSDPTRFSKLLEIFEKHKRVIVFYNFDYELVKLRELERVTTVAEWNGHQHQPVPTTERWVYLVQYVSGAEAWNCIDTNCILFFSLNYSFKLTKQAKGRIDRMNTPFSILHYYSLSSESSIDRGIKQALSEKKDFNEKRFVENS